MSIETPLEGGNTNEQVVRIGNTVRRTQTIHSPSVHALLQHLEREGFHQCPAFLGIDEHEREILSFIEGETEISESLWLTHSPLIETARLLKNYHEASASFVTDDTMHWAICHEDASQHEVICHNDFAPYNFIYSQGIPKAIIDFDLAGPGPRLRDVAYAAYWLAPLSFSSQDLVEKSQEDLNNGSPRLKLFCRSYGIAANTELLNMVEEVLIFMGDKVKVASTVGEVTACKLESEGHLKHWQQEAKAFEKKRAKLDLNLAQSS